MAQEFSRTRYWFATRASVVPFEQPLIPWLGTTSNHIDDYLRVRTDYLSRVFDLNAALKNQHFSGTLEASSFSISLFRDYPMRPIAIDITSINLDEGSVWSAIRGVLTAGVAAVTLYTAALDSATGRDWQLETKIEQSVSGQTCNGKASWKVDLESLRQLTPRQLNYDEPGINAYERALRVCNVQLALSLAQGIPWSIDGKLGPDTKGALEIFAKQNGVRDDIKDGNLQALLAKQFQRPPKEGKR